MRCLLFLLLLTALTACREELYSNLSEQEANAMMALLLSHGIDCDKARDSRSGKVTLQVRTSEFARAITLLQEQGYPNEQFSNPGQIFSGDSLISSPVEEHARYSWALSQDLARTITAIDGILTARVHVVLPESGKKDAPEASAAVFIRYRPGIVKEDLVPRIKSLVQAGIGGLKYENVSVGLFQAAPIRLPATAPEGQDDFPWLPALLATGMALLVAVLFGLNARGTPLPWPGREPGGGA